MRKQIIGDFADTFKKFYEGVNGYSEHDVPAIQNELTIKFANGSKVVYTGHINVRQCPTIFGQYTINVGILDDNGWSGNAWPKLNVEYGLIDCQPVDEITYMSGQTGELFILRYKEEE